MPQTFDLLRNPFVRFGLDLTATPERIAEAYEDAIVEEIGPESELNVVRQTLLVPALRLAAEVSALPDTPSQEWRPILTALKSAQSTAALRQAFAAVSPLSRANLLTHIASHVAPDTDLLAAWLFAQSEIDSHLIYDEIVAYRDSAGIVKPEMATLSDALGDLKELQAKSLFEKFENPADAINIITNCTRDAVSDENDAVFDELGTLLHAYNQCLSLELSSRRSNLAQAIAAIRSSHENADNFKNLEATLRAWGSAALPLQLFEERKERDDPYSQTVFQEIRGLALGLANDASEFATALAVTNLALVEFKHLPRAIQKLIEDRTALEERVASAHLEPFAVVVRDLEKDTQDLADELRADGFGDRSTGGAKALRDAFLIAVKSPNNDTADARALPWLMLRSIGTLIDFIEHFPRKFARVGQTDRVDTSDGVPATSPADRVDAFPSFPSGRLDL